jgi:D-glycero-D-manno-heptose 1,7-bisphosphate phosphatase
VSGHSSPALPGLEDADAGLWREICAADFVDRAALFLDRDGVIIEDTRYLGRPENLRLLPGAGEAVARCNRLEIPVVLVSNQSGIARGYYDWAAFQAVQAALAAALAKSGARLDAIFACAHHAIGRPPLNVADHPWRKPNPGMLVAAGERMKLDLSRSWIVGDRASDLAAGRAAQLAGGVLLSARDEDRDRATVKALATGQFAVEFAARLQDAVSLLLTRGHLGGRG